MSDLIRGPIAIGGDGGSGTRVVAQIVKESGYYFGSDLNKSQDNLWFTILFRRPKWLYRSNRKTIMTGFSLFEDAMTGRLKPNSFQVLYIFFAMLDFIFFEYKTFNQVKISWAIDRAKSLLRSRKTAPQMSAWGWKEPNTHIYLDYITEHFANLRYIHVIRHGLDMAYSQNQKQLFNWAPLFGVPLPDSPHTLPKASLQYWIKSNEQAFTRGHVLLGDRFYVVNYDKLCLCPEAEIQQLLTWLEVDVSLVKKLAKLVKPPSSLGRYKMHDMTVFSQQEVEAVWRLGFDVDGIL